METINVQLVLNGVVSVDDFKKVMEKLQSGEAIPIIDIINPNSKGVLTDISIDTVTEQDYHSSKFEQLIGYTADTTAIIVVKIIPFISKIVPFIK